MTELRDDVLGLLAREGLRPDLSTFEDDLEQWLSFLAAKQPWLTDETHLENQALFGRVSKLITRSIVAREAKTTMVKAPTWLAQIATHWATSEAPIITLNYDLLVERTLGELKLLSNWSDLYALHTAEREPAGSSRFLSSNPPAGSLPTLAKLHGSTNWLYGGITAPVTEEIFQEPGFGRWDYTQASDNSATPRSRFIYSDKTAMIVPPSGTKNDWYSNLSLRAQWRWSASCLSRCDELVVMGYSLPPTDLSIRHLIAQNLSKTAAVEVVDLKTDTRSKLEALLRRPVGQNFMGADAIEQYAKGL